MVPVIGDDQTILAEIGTYCQQDKKGTRILAHSNRDAVSRFRTFLRQPRRGAVRNLIFWPVSRCNTTDGVKSLCRAAREENTFVDPMDSLDNSHRWPSR
jgi:hypothetical protein